MLNIEKYKERLIELGIIDLNRVGKIKNAYMHMIIFMKNMVDAKNV